MSTLYQILGLQQGANQQQVKAAFRTLARRFHPDVNSGDQAAEQRFKEVQDAYETLADPGARAAYDRALVCYQDKTRRRFWSLARTAVATFALTSTVSLAVWWSQHVSPQSAPPLSGIGSTPDRSAQHGTHGGEDAKAMRSSATVGTLKPGRHKGAGWITYQNARFSFALKYPADVFAFDTGPGNDNVRTFLSRDGDAQLRIFARENADGTTLVNYRRSLIEERYASVELDHVPQHKFWFVLTGTRGDTVFYHRVIFSCDGKSMHGWEMIYPSSERTFYDLVVDEVQRNYAHTGRANARCGGGRQ
jgi:hypothetical protein